MESKENKGKKSGNKTKQEITVPFLWEEKPGAPKEYWKTPKREPLTPVPQPVKYIASVPFKWEEKPGTPLRCFLQETKEHSTKETVLENKSLPLPPAYFTKYGKESDCESSYDDDCDYKDWLSELDFEALDALSEESSSSGSSLLQANGPTPSRAAESSTVPLKNPYLGQQIDGYKEGSSSPERCNSPSCATRNETLRGASLVEYLFPLYPPKSRFLDKPDNSDDINNGHVEYNNERRLPTLEEYKKIKADFRRSGVIRRPPTLGELIMQSRRRSYRKKAVEMKKKNLPKDYNEEKPQGCFNLGASGGGLTKLLGKDLLTLKVS